MQAENAVLADNNNQTPVELQDHLTTEGLLRCFVSLKVPELKKEEYDFMRALYELSADHYPEHEYPTSDDLQADYARLTKQERKMINPERFSQCMSCIKAAENAHRFYAQIHQELERSAPNDKAGGDETISISTRLVERQEKQAVQKMEENSAKLDNFITSFQELPSELSYCLISLKAACLYVTTTHGNIVSLTPTERNVIDAIVHNDQLKEQDNKKIAELAARLMEIDEAYRQIKEGKGKHTARILHLQQSVVNAKTYASALALVEAALNQQKKHYEEGRFFSRVLKKIGAAHLLTLDFAKKMNKTNSSFHYSRMLSLVLQGEYKKHEAFSKPEVATFIDNIKPKVQSHYEPTLQWLMPSISDEQKAIMQKISREILDASEKGLKPTGAAETKIIAYRLVKGLDHIDDASVLKKIFPDLKHELEDKMKGDRSGAKEFFITENEFNVILKALLSSGTEKAIKQLDICRHQRLGAGIIGERNAVEKLLNNVLQTKERLEHLLTSVVENEGERLRSKTI